MTGSPRPARRRPRRERAEPARFIAHDINNLLTAIACGAELILARGADPATLADAGEIRAAAARGTALVQALLEREGAAAPPCPIPLNRTLAGFAGLLRRFLGSRIRLELSLAEPEIMVPIDPAGLERVLLNLAANARNAMPEGGTLRLRSRAMTRAAPDGGTPARRSARIEVADSGSGIAPEILPRIFAPRVTTRGGRGGHGLGLAAARAIIRRAGGWISVESTSGQGTSFSIDLPCMEGDALPPERDASAFVHVFRSRSLFSRAIGASGSSTSGDHALVPPRPGLRALLVEDEDAVGRVARLALEKAGWTVELAPSAESVLATLDRRARPDILVSDVSMPGMDGPGLVRHLRERWPGLPVILVSGYADRAAAAEGPSRALAAEGVRFLSKPYSLASLLAAMADLAAMAGASEVEASVS